MIFNSPWRKRRSYIHLRRLYQLLVTLAGICIVYLILMYHPSVRNDFMKAEVYVDTKTM